MHTLTDSDIEGIREVERNWNETVVAVVIRDGAVYDHCFNSDTAENMALYGDEVIVLGGDPFTSRDIIQRRCDANLAAYRDCYGIEV